MKTNRKRRNKSGSAIAEFGAAFYAFCIVIMLPTINFLSFAVSMSYSYLCANITADRVAQSITPKRASNILKESVTNLKSDPLANLLKVTASDGDFKLELVKSNMHGQPIVLSTNPKDFERIFQQSSTQNIVQYQVTTNYTSHPFLDLGSVPGINQIPIIGKESTLAFKMLRQPEQLPE